MPCKTICKPTRGLAVSPSKLCISPTDWQYPTTRADEENSVGHERPNGTAAYQSAMPLHLKPMVVCNAAPLIFNAVLARTRPPTSPRAWISLIKGRNPQADQRLGVLLWQRRGEHRSRAIKKSPGDITGANQCRSKPSVSRRA